MKTFDVQYIITCYKGEAIDEKLHWICLEQSVELPEEVVEAHILEKVSGQVKQVQKLPGNTYKAVITWPIENAGNDRTQFLNILYGNISLKRGIKMVSVDWESLNKLCSGPAFGIEGIRKRMNILDRPMVCGVLKPMGLSVDELATVARKFAFGGIDMIKDDHGLANQTYAPFRERVSVISQVLEEVEKETGHRAHYFPNITVSGSQLMQNYKLAADLGADGVMVLPELCGYEAMLELAESDIKLPIIAHPAFSGTFVTDPNHDSHRPFYMGNCIVRMGPTLWCIQIRADGFHSHLINAMI